MKVPIKDIENWYKDDVTGAVSCSDRAKYEQYMVAYRADLKEKEDFKALQNDVYSLKSDMSEIKSLLLTLAKNS